MHSEAFLDRGQDRGWSRRGEDFAGGMVAVAARRGLGEQHGQDGSEGVELCDLVAANVVPEPARAEPSAEHDGGAGGDGVQGEVEFRGPVEQRQACVEPFVGGGSHGHGELVRGDHRHQRRIDGALAASGGPGGQHDRHRVVQGDLGKRRGCVAPADHVVPGEDLDTGQRHVGRGGVGQQHDRAQCVGAFRQGGDQVEQPGLGEEDLHVRESKGVFEEGALVGGVHGYLDEAGTGDAEEGDEGFGPIGQEHSDR
ncbi:hypothetical protein M2161_000142 [Streptomyces sp. SAI-133]|nr:hypothetical protein [Streptomyces sp. SAI-133]